MIECIFVYDRMCDDRGVHLPGATPIRYSRSSIDSEHAPTPAALRQ